MAMQQPAGRIRSPQPPIAVPSTGRSILTGLRLLLGILVLAWAAGQLGWAGWLLAGPPGWLVPESIASAGELALWLAGSGLVACVAATVLLSGGEQVWHVTVLSGVIGWVAWPARVLLERWWLLGTLVFEPQGGSLGVPWPVREGWLVLLVVSGVGALVTRHCGRVPAR
jgi:hypothetical protein